MKNQDGFTLIELIIVIAIGAILSTVGFLSFSSYKNKKDIEFSLNEVSSVVKEVRDRSITQEDGKAWGVRFNSSSIGVDSYEIFYGSSYSTSSVEDSWGFRRPVEFSEPSGGRTVDLTFEAITGKIDNRKIISMVHKNNVGRVGDIVINTLGKATTRLEDDIVGYWHFDEGTGTSTVDASGNENNGELEGDPTWTSGSNCKAGECLEFDGTGDYVDISDSNIFNTDARTISAWIKTTATGIGTASCNIVARVQNVSPFEGFVLNINRIDSGRISYYTGGWYSTNSAIYNDGEWHHVAVVHENNNLIFYIDGVQDGTHTVPSPTNHDTNLLIGKERDAMPRYFEGNIDEVKVYDTALSSSTIKSIYEDLK